jgi:hypothetical protein
MFLVILIVWPVCEDISLSGTPDHAVELMKDQRLPAHDARDQTDLPLDCDN